jgi:hypothetical protein
MTLLERQSPMPFDASTLEFAGGVVALASGLFLLIHWWQARGDRAALSWGIASCGIGVGVVLLSLQGTLPAYASNVAGPLILDIAAAWTWAASRIFNRGSIKHRPLIVAVGVWIATLIVSGATGHERFAAGFGSTVSALLYAAGAVEFWRARSEQLRGRWAMISLLSMFAISIFMLAVEVSLFRPILEMPSTSWLGAIRFLGLIYAGGSALSLVTMLKDRSEIKYRAAALIDPLTGLANRRSFMDAAQRMFE